MGIYWRLALGPHVVNCALLYSVNGSVSLCAGLCLSALHVYIVRVLLAIIVFGCEN